MKRICSAILSLVFILSAFCFPQASAAQSSAAELTIAEKISLINSATLNPMRTNYAPLDEMVDKILSQILTDGMSTYEKVRACYQYIVDGSQYKSNDITTQMYYSLWKEIRYENFNDSLIVSEAFGFLSNKIGICTQFSSAFLVLTRAIGLESFNLCNSSTAPNLGSGDHFQMVILLKGEYYRFDPVMDVVRETRDLLEKSENFCGRIVNDKYSVFCNPEECASGFGGFTVGIRETVSDDENYFPTVGDIHYNFGSYPQSLVTDSQLITSLNGLLDKSAMRSFRYMTGTGEQGTQKADDYMKWADVSYQGNKYRAVTFSSYRPIYTFFATGKEYSYQDNNGYDPGTVYWFLFEPIKWRLIDGTSLLVSDMILDAQAFNNTVFTLEKGNTIDGKKYYSFADAACSIPANEWARSSIRRWLNEDFYNTAFSTEEKENIRLSTLKNSGFRHCFDFADTQDRVFLLSYNDVENSPYVFTQDQDSRIASSTDYTACQGISIGKKSGVPRGSWLLRSAGEHSGDVTVVIRSGRIQKHINVGTTMMGVRPALRVKTLSFFHVDEIAAPESITAEPTATGQITVSVAPVNGADGYRFYLLSNETGEYELFRSNDGPTVVIDGLTPGVDYTFCASAVKTEENGVIDETDRSPSVTERCHQFITIPSGVTIAATATNELTLTWDAVPHAVEYRIYSYQDANTLVPLGTAYDTVYHDHTVYAGYTYYYRVTAVTADGFESYYSNTVNCKCVTIPGSTQTENKAKPSACPKGDADGNGKVESADARLVLRASVNLEIIIAGTESFIASDINNNNKLEASDARLILRASVGLEQL